MSSDSMKRAGGKEPGPACAAGGHDEEGREVTRVGGRHPGPWKCAPVCRRESGRDLDSLSGGERDGNGGFWSLLRGTDLENSYWKSLEGSGPLFLDS